MMTMMTVVVSAQQPQDTTTTQLSSSTSTSTPTVPVADTTTTTATTTSTEGINNNANNNNNNDTVIYLRVGAVASAPMTMDDSNSGSDDDSTTGGGKLTGLQIDLLYAIRDIAKDVDGYNLQLDITDLREKYRPAESFDLVSKECTTSAIIHNVTTDCGMYDLILAPIFTTPQRYELADVTPSWIQDYISASYYSESIGRQYNTLEELERVNGTYCGEPNSYYVQVISEEYPNLKLFPCKVDGIGGYECVESLKVGNCSLQAGLGLGLTYASTLDTTLVRTRVELRRNFIGWPMSYALDEHTRYLFKRWFVIAISNNVVDELYTKYYESIVCPLGYAGENCTQYCNPQYGRSNRLGICICDSTKYTGVDCNTIVEENTNMIPTYSLVIGYVLFTINVVLVIVCFLWLYTNRRKPNSIGTQEPIFLYLVLLGCLTSSSTILALMQQAGPTEDDDDYDDDGIYCMAIPWLYSVGFSITFGTLFTRIYRVHKLVGAATRLRRVTFDIYSALFWILGVLCIDATILIIWQILNPLHWTRVVLNHDKYGETLASIGMCTSTHWEYFASIMGTFHFILICIASYMCYATRKIPNSLSCTRGVSIAMISNLQIFIVGIPMVLLVSNDPQSSFFVRSAIVWMNDLAVVAIIFADLKYGSNAYGGDGSTLETMARETVASVRGFEISDKIHLPTPNGGQRRDSSSKRTNNTESG